MWVKNQDGLAVVEVQALALDPAEIQNFNPESKDHKVIRIWGSINDHDYVMGVYYDIEEAIEILADFVHAIISRNSAVFVMPKAVKQPNEVQ